MNSAIRATLIIFLFTCLEAGGLAAEKPGPLYSVQEAMRAAEQEKVSEDSLGWSTPQGTLVVFLKAAIQEDLLLRIMDIVEQNGSGFAFPSQTMYLATDSGVDAEKRQEAMRKVREWREKGELPFPDFRPKPSPRLTTSSNTLRRSQPGERRLNPGGCRE